MQRCTETIDSIVDVVAIVPIEQVFRNSDASAADRTSGYVLSDEPLTNAKCAEVVVTCRGYWLYNVLNEYLEKGAGKFVEVVKVRLRSNP